MSNIHTLADVASNDNNNNAEAEEEARRNQPVPNPWSSSSSGGRVLASGQMVHDNDDNQSTGSDQSFGSNPTVPLTGPQQMRKQLLEQKPDEQFWSYNLEGPPTLNQMFLSILCPCLVGNPCSKVRRWDYFRFALCVINYITALQIIVFAFELIWATYKYGSPIDLSFANFLGPPTAALVDMGAKYGPLIKFRYQLWRVITPIFLHGSIFHLFFNMLIQFLIGPGYERSWNFAIMLAVYFIAGIGGNLLSLVLLPNTPSVGASGAILGLIGAKLSHTICRWHKLPNHLKVTQTVSCLSVLGFTFLLSLSSFIDAAAHVGGAFVGLCLGLFLFWHHIQSKWLRYLTLLGSFAALIFFFASTILLFVFVTPVQQI